MDNARKVELDSLRLACYIGPKDFFKPAMKAAKKKNDPERMAIINEIGKLRGFIKDPEIKDCHWYI